MHRAITMTPWTHRCRRGRRRRQAGARVDRARRLRGAVADSKSSSGLRSRPGPHGAVAAAGAEAGKDRSGLLRSQAAGCCGLAALLGRWWGFRVWAIGAGALAAVVPVVAARLGALRRAAFLRTIVRFIVAQQLVHQLLLVQPASRHAGDRQLQAGRLGTVLWRQWATSADVHEQLCSGSRRRAPTCLRSQAAACGR